MPGLAHLILVYAGVAQNKTAAVEWFSRAAAQRHVESMWCAASSTALTVCPHHNLTALPHV